MMTAIETAQSANVVVYTIRYTDKEHGKLTARNRYGISVMDRVARETGGAHIDAETTDAHLYFRQIAEELRTSYELGYYPTDPLKDDTFRKIVIKPKREGVKVRAKTGYFFQIAAVPVFKLKPRRHSQITTGEPCRHDSEIELREFQNRKEMIDVSGWQFDCLPIEWTGRRRAFVGREGGHVCPR